jgi:hypothetical protein
VRFYDSTEDRFYMGRVVAAVILGLIVLWAIAAATFGLGVATAGIYGRGQQIRQVNSAENRTFQYNHFFNLNADVKSEVQQINTTVAAVNGTTDATEHSRLNAVLLGLENTNQYNADAAKVTTGALFRDNNLPQTCA